jgi:hypothetical protein
MAFNLSAGILRPGLPSCVTDGVESRRALLLELGHMRYRLRTLLILLAVGPMLLAGMWWGCAIWRARLRPVGYSVQPDGSVRIVTEP